MSQNAGFDDTSIPVLTEVVDETPAATPGPPPADAAAAAPAQLEARALEGWSEQQWELLERRVAERILQQLQGRVDFVLEQRLRDSMADVLRQALAGLTDEIRGALQQSVEQIVVRAVSQELTQLRALKK
jgi:hypothetical protein